MSRVIKDFENSRLVAEHLSRGQIVHFICLGVRPQTLVTKSILREKFRVFNNNIQYIVHLGLQNMVGRCVLGSLASVTVLLVSKNRSLYKAQGKRCLLYKKLV